MKIVMIFNIANISKDIVVVGFIWTYCIALDFKYHISNYSLTYFCFLGIYVSLAYCLSTDCVLMKDVQHLLFVMICMKKMQCLIGVNFLCF